MEKAGLKFIDEVRRLIAYDKETGLFTWKERPSNRVKIGEKVGFDNGNGYLRTSVCNTRVLLHQLAYVIVEGSYPDKIVDHINQKRDDNRWDNLRLVTRVENEQNKSLSKTNTSGQFGVRKARDKWQAYIRVNGVSKFLGNHSSYATAVIIRKAAEGWYGFHENHGRSK